MYFNFRFFALTLFSRMHVCPLKKTANETYYDLINVKHVHILYITEVILQVMIYNMIFSISLINWQVARASEMRKMTTFIRPNPTPADKIHCILYVMRATSNFSTKLSTSFNEMKKIQDSRKNDGMCFTVYGGLKKKESHIQGLVLSLLDNNELQQTHLINKLIYYFKIRNF